MANGLLGDGSDDTLAVHVPGLLVWLEGNLGTSNVFRTSGSAAYTHSPHQRPTKFPKNANTCLIYFGHVFGFVLSLFSNLSTRVFSLNVSEYLRITLLPLGFAKAGCKVTAGTRQFTEFSEGFGWNNRNCRESANNGIGIATETAGTIMKLQGTCKEWHRNCNGKAWDNYETAGKVQRMASELQRKGPGQL